MGGPWASDPWAEPHTPQKRADAGKAPPQEMHKGDSRAPPQAKQKPWPSGWPPVPHMAQALTDGSPQSPAWPEKLSMHYQRLTREPSRPSVRAERIVEVGSGLDG